MTKIERENETVKYYATERFYNLPDKHEICTCTVCTILFRI